MKALDLRCALSYLTFDSFQGSKFVPNLFFLGGSRKVGRGISPTLAPRGGGGAPCLSSWVSALKDCASESMNYCVAQGWVRGWPYPRTPTVAILSPYVPQVPIRLTATLSLPGVAISTYAKYCYHKLQKAALTGAKKVQMLLEKQGGANDSPAVHTEV